MIIYIVLIVSYSMFLAILVVTLIHILSGVVLPPLGFLYLTIAYICRCLQKMSFKEFKEKMNHEP